MRTDDRLTALVGIAMWAVAGALALACHGRLVATGNGWWVWSAPVGIVLGLLGLAFLHRRHHRARPDGAPEADRPTGPQP